MKSVKAEAALDMVKFVLVILAAQAVVFLGIKFLSAETAVGLVMVGVLAYTLRTLFQIRCSQIEFERSRKESK